VEYIEFTLLEIEDRGLGFDPQLVMSQRGHLGLAGMAERARELGWSLSVEKDLLRLETEEKISFFARQVPASARCVLAGILVYWRQAEGRRPIHGS
jgi:hypothetical protein